MQTNKYVNTKENNQFEMVYNVGRAYWKQIKKIFPVEFSNSEGKLCATRMSLLTRQDIQHELVNLTIQLSILPRDTSILTNFMSIRVWDYELSLVM